MLPRLLQSRAALWVCGPLALCLLVAFSLEEVTNDPPPLDPRFVQIRGDSDGGSSSSVVPFADYEGSVVLVSGEVLCDEPGVLDMDLWRVDPKSSGDRVHLGKVPAVMAGSFELRVPQDFGPLWIEVLRDLTGDGPSMDDLFGRVVLEVGSSSMDGIELVLAVGGVEGLMGGGGQAGGAGAAGTGGPMHVAMPPGAEGSDTGMGRVSDSGLSQPSDTGMEHLDVQPGAPGGEAHPHEEIPLGEGESDTPHVEAEPGAPGGGEHPHIEAPPGAPGGGGEHVHDAGARPGGSAPSGPAADPFSSVPGPRVTLSGTITYAGADTVLDLDVFRTDASGPGGRVFVGKKKLSPGAFVLEIPSSFEIISFEVFLDATGDGPSADDPFAACPCNPVNLSRGDVDGLIIHLK